MAKSDEIPVTAEMIEAGIRAINISAYHSVNNKRKVLAEVYRAMRALEPAQYDDYADRDHHEYLTRED